MKEYVEVIQGVDHCHTKLLLKVTGGQACKKEAQEYVKKCDQYQRFALNIHQPGGVHNPLSSLWPFA